MANDKLIKLKHLTLSATRCAAMVDDKIDELITAVSEDMTELDDAKQDKLTGTAGQFVGFDESGNPIAQEVSSGGGTPIVTATSTDGVTYTATVDGMDSLVVGMELMLVPNYTSTAINPKLNVNGLGDKYLRCPVTSNNATTSTAVNTNWLYSGKPVKVRWNGTFWVTDIPRVDAATLYNNVPVSKGGTGASDAATARANLGAASIEEVEEFSDRVTALESKEIVTLPDYWEEHIAAKTEAITALHIAGGKDCFSFPLLTDIHIRQNLGKYSGQLVKRILDECYLPYALCVGDIVNRGSGGESDMDTDFVTAEALLKPIRDRLLQTQGNHDGSWGYKDYDGDGTVDYYGYNFTPEKLHTLIYRKVGLVGDCHFDASGTGYYIDDVSNKVRYIILNSHNNVYEEDDTDLAVYNNMTCWKFQQSQFDMVAEALSTMPSDEWCAITASHIPLNHSTSKANLTLMAQMLNAYKAKTAFSGSYAGEYGYDTITADVDFTAAKGEYIGHFAGHTHIDSVAVYNGITVFTTRCDGSNEPSDSGLTKTEGTVTEQSFDVFTINRAEKKIYVTKIGAGDNRYWDYANGVEFDPNDGDSGTDTASYSITTVLSNCTGASDNATTISEGGTATLTFTAHNNYVYDSVTVEGATYSWSETGDVGTLVLSNPTGNVTVTITMFFANATNIIDTVGYTDGIRLSGSDGVSERTAAGYTTTGMITFPAGATLDAAGVNFDSIAHSVAMIYRYNLDTEAFIGAYTAGQTIGQSSITSTLGADGNGLEIVNSSSVDIKVRLTGYGSGADLVVLIHEA